MASQRFLKTVLGCAIAGMAGGSWAQNSEIALEEILVTAEKRVQSLQDVPISIVAFDTKMLTKLGIDELDDIGANIPNLYINNFNNDPVAVRMFIRGIGQNDMQLTQDPSVALYLDGVYIGTTFGAGFEGVDIERLEVLRGPQGTLYGRNATGGAINIITRRASTEALTFQQTFEAGNLNLFKSKTFANIPLNEQWAVKLGYLHTQRDGYVENNGVGDDFGDEDRASGVIDLHYQASDTLAVDYRYEKAQIEDTGRLEQSTRAGDPAELPPGVPNLAALVTPGIVSTDRADKVTSLWPNDPSDVDISAHTLHISWQLNENLTLNSITADRSMESDTSTVVMPTWRANLVPGGGAISNGINQIEFDQFSQELQVIGAWEQWDWAAGIYYYEDEGTHDSRLSQSLGLPPPTFDIATTENESIAIYSQATWTPAAMNSRWHITLGARYSEDDRKAFRRNTRSADFAASAPDGASYSESFSNFNPSLTVAFDLDDANNVYAKVVSGYKSGGTSTRSANATLFRNGFDEEDIVSYELGYKGEFWDRRARLNSAIFYMDMDGLQTSIQTGSTPGERDFLPIDGNTIQGLELDLTLALSENLTGTVSYGYLDTELGADYVDSAAGRFYLVEVMSYAPENSYTVALDYTRPLSNGSVNARLAYNYQDTTATSVNASDDADTTERKIIDASVSWADIKLGDMAGSLTLMLWGKNLSDDEYTILNTGAWGFTGSNETATFGDPRTYGLSVTYNY